MHPQLRSLCGAECTIVAILIIINKRNEVKLKYPFGTYGRKPSSTSDIFKQKYNSDVLWNIWWLMMHLVPKMVTRRVAWALVNVFLRFIHVLFVVHGCSPFWSWKGNSTILYVTFSFVLLRLFSSLENIPEKFSQTTINLKPSKKQLESYIHFPWFQIWILVLTARQIWLRQN